MLCLVLLFAETPIGGKLWLDWNHQFRWAVMVGVFYQWVLPLSLLSACFLFWRIRKEYQVRWRLLALLCIVFPVLVSLWQRGDLFIDLPELAFALVLVFIGLFFRIGRIVPVWIVILLGISFEIFQLFFLEVRFFEWKDIVINLMAILAGYYLVEDGNSKKAK